MGECVLLTDVVNEYITLDDEDTKVLLMSEENIEKKVH